MRSAIHAALIGLAVLTPVTRAAPQLPVVKDHSTRYDGAWWITVPQAEKDGFVAGFVDCYKYELRGPARFEARPLAEYRDSLSHYFVPGSQHLSESVAKAFGMFADRPGERPPAGGEEWREKHGYFDGNYWRQAFAAGGTSHQRGFVEGYLSCNQQLGPHRRVSYSGRPDAYVRHISQWYRFDSTSADMEPTRERTKIADVLFRFRDSKR